MSEPISLEAARRRAANRRRAEGVVQDFDPNRLALARRLKAMPRTKLSKKVELSPAAITQFEKGQAKPTVPVLQDLARVLDVTERFLRASRPVPELPARSAHFRSLRATTALERDQALAFGELVLAVFDAVEQYVDLPPVALPECDVPEELDDDSIALIAAQAREAFGIESGPVPHVVRLLEANGVAVVHLDQVSDRVDAFSHQHHDRRPLVLLSTTKNDKARSRFDGAHELGHLLMHHDAEPGSRIVEQQANKFAAEFLTPASEIIDDLPTRPDWVALQNLKRRWGVSLKSLVYRSRYLGRFTDSSYRSALKYLASQGPRESGSLGDVERPVLLPRAMELIGPHPRGLEQLAREAGLDFREIDRVWTAAGGATISRRVHLTTVDEPSNSDRNEYSESYD